MDLVKRFRIDQTYSISSFERHNEFKISLLNLFKTINHSSKMIDNYYTEKITKYDWPEKNNSDREWVKLIAPALCEKLIPMINKNGFDQFDITSIWFQQYHRGDSHGWHIHSDNLAGIYFLELPSTVPPTQFVNPINLKSIINTEVKEGDVLLFPSNIIHRAPLMTTDERRTIISFNVKLGNLCNWVLDNLNNPSKKREY